MNLIPDINDLWKGIGGTFDSFTNILAEVIDNSISNLLTCNTLTKCIIVNIENVDENTISVKITDNGSGISNLESALKIGSKALQSTSMNEHGFGIKHALASANPENNNWSITTKTNNKIYHKVSAPYDYNLEEIIIDSTIIPFPSEFKTGTIVEFTCSKNLFFTLRKGKSGIALENKCLEYLSDDLSFLYSNFLLNNNISITILSKDFNFNCTIKPLIPYYVGYYKPKKGTITLNLGGGDVTVQYIFGEIDDLKTSRKYYKKNQMNSGCEIRLNGRLLDYNIFTQIWDREVDPHYNHFLVQINVISDDPERLPSTKTTKSGIRLGDEKLIALYNWIRSVLPNPPRELTNSLSEKMLVNDLKKLKDYAFKDLTYNTIKEFSVFKNIGCPVNLDLYVFNTDSLLLYECKKGKAEPQNLYQLLMYWDGAVSDGLNPTKGILIAGSWSDGLIKLINYLNSRVDANGNNYNFALSTWKDEGIIIND